jgi:hypothetical protein
VAPALLKAQLKRSLLLTETKPLVSPTTFTGTSLALPSPSSPDPLLLP